MNLPRYWLAYMSIYTRNSEYSILLIQLILLRSVFSITHMGIFLLEGFSSYQTSLYLILTLVNKFDLNM